MTSTIWAEIILFVLLIVKLFELLIIGWALFYVFRPENKNKENTYWMKLIWQFCAVIIFLMFIENELVSIYNKLLPALH